MEVGMYAVVTPDQRQPDLRDYGPPNRALQLQG